MGFGCGVGDFIAISGLAVRVYIAYKDAPGRYRHISEEVAALQILIDKAAQHFKSTTLSSDDHHNSQKVLEGCQGVLQDLYSLIEKHKRLASTIKGLGLTGVRLGKGDNITTLHAQLISNTGLLNGFVQRFVDSAIPLHQPYKY